MIRSVGHYKQYPLRHVIQTEFFKTDPGRGGASYPAAMTEECSAGRFRTIRRGKTLSFLASTYDSDSFQVLHSEEVTDEPLHFNDIHLRANCGWHNGQEGQVSVIWKYLRVRATKIVNLQTNRPPLPLEPK